VLTGNTPFHLLLDAAVIPRVIKGARPEIPVGAPVAADKSGLWLIVQQCWEEEPFNRPALTEVRDRLLAAAGMWDDDLCRSGSTDGYVSVSKDVLLSPDGSSDEESHNELEPGMSPYSLMQCSLYSTPERAVTPASANQGRLRNQSPHYAVAVRLRNGGRARAPSRRESLQIHTPEGLWGLQPQPCDSRQNLVISMQPNEAMGLVQEGTQSGDVESESDLEPPDDVYIEPRY